jgi:hypothetical protein
MVTKSASAASAPEGTTALAPEQVAALNHATAKDKAIAAAIGAVVDAWWIEHIHNSPVSQATEAYRHFHERLPVLVAQLTAAVKQEI